MPKAHAMESVLVLVDALMDMSIPIGKGPEAVPESGFTTDDVFNLLTEILGNVDIVGHEKDGRTVYVVRLSPESADILAAMDAAMEDGDELDKGELDELDRGEDEHDGREPDPKDVR